jgi:hypothetical protein
MSKQIARTYKQYGAFFNEIKNRISSARINVARVVNRDLIKLYWDIGEIIVTRQKQQGWGQGVVEQLAVVLADDFKGLEGFSANNLWRIKILQNLHSLCKKFPGDRISLFYRW